MRPHRALTMSGSAARNTEERTGEVDREVAVPLVEGDLVEPGEPAHGSAGDHDLDRAERPPCGLEARGDRGFVGDVHRDREGPATVGLDLGGGLLGGFSVEVHHRDAMPVAGELQSYRPADAGPCSP